MSSRLDADTMNHGAEKAEGPLLDTGPWSPLQFSSEVLGSSNVASPLAPVPILIPEHPEGNYQGRAQATSGTDKSPYLKLGAISRLVNGQRTRTFAQLDGATTESLVHHADMAVILRETKLALKPAVGLLALTFPVSPWPMLPALIECPMGCLPMPAERLIGQRAHGTPVGVGPDVGVTGYAAVVEAIPVLFEAALLAIELMPTNSQSFVPAIGTADRHEGVVGRGTQTGSPADQI